MITLKQSLKATVVITFFFFSAISLNAQNGEKLFKSACAACHTIGGGKRVGPDLNGIATLRSEDWLIQWTRSSESLIQSGDPEAIAIFEEFNRVPMPDQNLTDAEIKEVIEYIREKSSPVDVSAVAVS